MRLKDKISFNLLRGTAWLLAFPSRRVMLKVANCLADFFFYFVPIRQKVARKNIHIAFPEMTETEQRNLLKKSYRHFALVFIDFFRLSHSASKHPIIHYEDNALGTFRRHSNGIILTAHLGNWELFGHALAAKGIPVTAVVRRQRNAGANEFFIRTRNQRGLRTIFSNAGSRPMMKVMQKEYFGIASDQFNKRGGEVTFFGRPTRIANGMAVFHLRTRVPLILSFCVRDDNNEYHIFAKEYKFGDMELNEKTIARINQQYTNDLEDMVRRYPEQYFWFHRKFKSMKKTTT